MFKSLLILGIGGCGGYFIGRHLTKSHLEGKFLLQLDQEAAKYKKYYEARYQEKIGELEPEVFAEPLLKDAAEALTKYQGNPAPIFNDPRPAPKIEEVEIPIRQPEDADFEYVDPTPTKLTVEPPDRPYIIPEEEFWEKKNGYEQQPVTYFAGDGVVVGVDDLSLSDTFVEQYIGVHNLERFGTMSSDEDVVHIRYDKFKQEFEVTRDARAYTAVYGGMTEDD